ncbi:MAG: hypothetical protein ACRCTJ_06360 [Brevinema sp.]
MNNRNFKQLFTLFFLAFTILIALHIPVHAVLSSPLFEKDQIKTFSLKQQQFSIFRSKGICLSNINNTHVVTFAPIQKAKSLYDLHLDFNENDYLDNYFIVHSNYEAKMIEDKSFGKFVLKNEIILLPNKRSILNTESDSSQSFSIKFSLLPYTTGEGSQIIAKYATENAGENKLHYGFSISIEKGIMNYHFKNFFTDKNENTYSFTLQEKEPLIDNKIEEHFLIVDMSAKIIKIYRNGKEQSVRLLTDDESVFGEPLQYSVNSVKNQTIPFIIGRNPVFALDYFSILKEVEHINSQKHKDYEEHFFETDVVTISSNNSWINSVTPIFDQKEHSFYRIAYRLSGDYFLPETKNNQMPWVYIDSEKKSFPPSQKLGKYLQLRFEYYEQESEHSINLLKLEDIVTSFRETPLPEIVKIKNIIAGDQKIEILWDAVPGESMDSYEIFYGTSPNYYFGSATISPKSPISVRKKHKYPEQISYTIEGIQNNQPYYISIRAKNKYGVYGKFSKELSSIPMSTKNELGYSIGR